MTRIALISTVFLLSNVLSGQISVDSVGIIKSGSLDSFYVSLQLPDLDFKKVEFASLNDGSNTQVYNFYFNGCPLSQLITYFDTIIMISAPPPYRLIINTIYDTTQYCPFPSVPIITDSVIISSTALGNIENKVNDGLFSLSPNPADNLIQLQMNTNMPITQIELLDIQGKIVRTYDKNIRQLKIHNIPQGVYFVKVYSTKNHLTRKIIVQ